MHIGKTVDDKGTKIFRETVGTSASSPSEAMNRVKTKEPEAFILTRGAKKCVAVPKTGMIPYRVIGPEEYTSDAAWAGAAERLGL